MGGDTIYRCKCGWKGCLNTTLSKTDGACPKCKKDLLNDKVVSKMLGG